MRVAKITVLDGVKQSPFLLESIQVWVLGARTKKMAILSTVNTLAS